MDHFNEEDCLAVFSELANWTSIPNILAAVRIVENKILPTDNPSETLVVPFYDSDGFERVLTKMMLWLIKSYAVPEYKIKLAEKVYKVKTSSLSYLKGVKFKPDIEVGPAGAINKFFEGVTDHMEDRFFIIRDAPEVIEVIQTPIRCMTHTLMMAWDTILQLKEIKRFSDRTADTGPTIVHQPYTDGPLFALIEAMAFYVSGLEIGPNPDAVNGGINRGYRSFEVVGTPPIDVKIFKIAQDSCRQMFNSLK